MACREQLTLVGRLAVGGGPDGGCAGGVDHALHVRPQTLLHHELHAGHVDREQSLAVLGANRGHPGAMKDLLGALHGAANRPAVTQLELESPAVQIGDRGVRRAVLYAERDVVATLDQKLGDV